MQRFISKSSIYPQPLVIEPRMIDVNEDVETIYVTDEETGEKFVCGYQYTTYRFRNYAEYTAWLNERKDTKIAEQQDQIALLEGCIMELTSIISDIIEGKAIE